MNNSSQDHRFSHVRLQQNHMAILSKLSHSMPDETRDEMLVFHIGRDDENRNVFDSFIKTLKEQKVLIDDTVATYPALRGGYEIHIPADQFQRIVECNEMFEARRAERRPGYSARARERIAEQETISEKGMKWRHGQQIIKDRDAVRQRDNRGNR